MSSKNFNFINRLRSKSFDKAIISGNNLASYHYVDNFDNATEDECMKLDVQNRDIYKKNMELYDNIAKKIENKNAMFRIDTPPSPPTEPNNHDRFISHKLRNISKNVRYQSYAINYLLNKGYKIIYEQKQNKLELEFEPHDAIDLCERLEAMSIDQILKRDFPNVYVCKNSPNVYNNRKSMNLNIPPNYYPVYPSENYQYNTLYSPSTPSSTNSVPNTPNTNMSFIYPSAPPLSYPTLSSSAPSTSNLQQKISAPPASHYIHHN
jgi:hypothetical protein